MGIVMFLRLWVLLPVCQAHLVVGPEVVHLLSEYINPEVFTDELHHVQVILEARGIFGEPDVSKTNCV